MQETSTSDHIPLLQQGTADGSVVQRVGPRKGDIDGNNDLVERTAGTQPASTHATTAQYVTGNVNWGGVGNETVGIQMIGTIGPNHPYGSSPNTGATPNNITWAENNSTNHNTYVRGHLLNGHLGGPGQPENLFPITSSANSLHEIYVENEIKAAVNTLKQWVRYQVDVIDHGNGDATFDCRWWYIQTGGANVLGPLNRVEINSWRDQFATINAHAYGQTGPNPVADGGFANNQVLAQGGLTWGTNVEEINWTNYVNNAFRVLINRDMTKAQEDNFFLVYNWTGAYEVNQGVTVRAWNDAVRSVRNLALLHGFNI